MKSISISALIRAKRLEKGLSLSQLAKLAGTSTATLSRYENGWQRFEIYTLRKMASALGCRLNISFEDLSAQKTVDSISAVDQLKRLFWDKPLDAELIASYPKWVIQRVLETGNLDDINMVINLYGKKKLLNVVSTTRFSSAKTANFWKLILTKENIPCTKRSYPATAENCWQN